MAAGAAAAPEVVLSGALLVQLAACLVLIVLLKFYSSTFGAFIRRLADMVEDIWVVGGKLSDALNAMDHFVQSRMGDAIAGLEYSSSQTWGAMTWVVKEAGDALTSFGADVHAAIDGLIHGEVPAQIDARTRPITDRQSKSNAAIDSRVRAEAQARARGIDAVQRDVTTEARARERGIDAIDTRLSTQVLPRIRSLETGLRDVVGYTRRTLSRRLSRVEQLVLGGAITAGALAVLTRYFPYFQCTNVRGFNRALCRAPIGAIDDLFGLAFALVAVMNLDVFIRELQAITAFTSEAVADWVE